MWTGGEVGMNEEEIKEWVITHNTAGMSEKDIAKAIVKEMILTAKIAEDAYPGLREKLLSVISLF